VPQRCNAGSDGAVVEQCYWETLEIIRNALASRGPAVDALAARLRVAKQRLESRRRQPRPDSPHIEAAYRIANGAGADAPPELVLKPGVKTTLREELGRVLNYYNRASGGAFVVASADLLGSTSVSKISEGFPSGFYNRRSNPAARQLSTGGICEDAMTAMLAGISTFGCHVGVGSSYAAFSAPLGHIAARLHAIGNQARVAVEGGAYRPFILVCAHAGLKTGEDGPTHADPQSLQLLQDNFPIGTMITLTPWEPQEIWFLVAAALAHRPAVIAPFVTRPPETILDRAALGLPSAGSAVRGVCRLRAARGRGQGTVVLQGTGVTYEFVTKTMPLLEREGIDVNAYVITSCELFDLLPANTREPLFPEAHQMEAMGITDFTLSTMTRWVRSDYGRAHSLHPFRHGHYLGSGAGSVVMKEAGLDGDSQFENVRAYVRDR
jgi:transketolase